MQRSANGLNDGDVAMFHWLQRGSYRGVEGRQQRQAERADKEAKGVEPADGGGTEAGSDQPSDQDNIFSCLPALIAIRLYTLFAALGLGGHVTDKVLQRTHGTNPPAEEAAKKQRWQKNDQAPQQAAIKSVAGKRIDKGHQRVPLEEEADRGAQFDFGRAAGKDAQRGEEQQAKKEKQK